MEIDKGLDLGRLEKMDCRASESLVFGGLMNKYMKALKNAILIVVKIKNS